MTKSKAFWATYWALLACYAGAVISGPEALQSVGSVIVGAIAAAGAFYQASNVADNGIKGKFYREELDK